MSYGIRRTLDPLYDIKPLKHEPLRYDSKLLEHEPLRYDSKPLEHEPLKYDTRPLRYNTKWLEYDIEPFRDETGLLWHLKYKHWMESWLKPRDEFRIIVHQMPKVTFKKAPEPQLEMPEPEPPPRVPEPEPQLEMPEPKPPPKIVKRLDVFKSRKELEIRKKAVCPVCNIAFSSLLEFSRHAALSDTVSEEHTEWLKTVLGKPLAEFGWEFGWESDKKVATALTNYWWKHQKWPEK